MLVVFPGRPHRRLASRTGFRYLACVANEPWGKHEKTNRKP